MHRHRRRWRQRYGYRDHGQDWLRLSGSAWVSNRQIDVHSRVSLTRGKGKAPDHGSIGQSNREGSGHRRDEGVGRVQNGPDDDALHPVSKAESTLARRAARSTYKKGADKELDEEKVSIAGLRCTRKRAEDGARTAQGVGTETEFMEARGKGHHLGMELAYEQKSGQERAEDLGKNVVGDLLPREALPYGETDGHGRVEVTS